MQNIRKYVNGIIDILSIIELIRVGNGVYTSVEKGVVESFLVIRNKVVLQEQNDTIKVVHIHTYTTKKHIVFHCFS